MLQKIAFCHDRIKSVTFQMNQNNKTFPFSKVKCFKRRKFCPFYELKCEKKHMFQCLKNLIKIQFSKNLKPAVFCHFPKKNSVKSTFWIFSQIRIKLSDLHVFNIRCSNFGKSLKNLCSKSLFLRIFGPSLRPNLKENLDPILKLAS